MNPDQLAALRTFFATAEPHLADLVALMYERLFETSPEAASLFKGDMEEQQRQFALMLWSIVRLTRSSELWPINAATGQASIPAVEKLGVRHARAGVKREHFEAMKAALAECCRQMFADDFTPAADKALAFIFDVVSHASAGPKGGSPRSRMTQKAVAINRDADGGGFRPSSGDRQIFKQRPPRPR